MKLLQILVNSGVIPLTKDDKGKWRMNIMSWKNISAYVTWWLVPTVLFVTNLYLTMSVPHPGYSTIVDKVIQILNAIYIFVVPTALPILMAFLVSQSEVPLHTTHYSKLPLLFFYFMITISSIGLSIYGAINGNYDKALATIQIILQLLISINNLLTMLIINLVCNAIIDTVIHTDHKIETDDVVNKYVMIVQQYKLTTRGFSPFLLVLLPLLTMYFLVYSFTAVHLIAKGNIISSGPQILTLLGYLAYILYIVIICDETTQTLTEKSMILREMALRCTNEYKMEKLTSVIGMIENLKPFDALGFFYVETKTFMAIISNAIAYLVLMIQFGL